MPKNVQFKLWLIFVFGGQMQEALGEIHRLCNATVWIITAVPYGIEMHASSLLSRIAILVARNTEHFVRNSQHFHQIYLCNQCPKHR